MEQDRPRKPLWNATHRHLDRALAVCGLSPCEQTIMVIAREESYGKARLRKLPDPLPFRVNLSRLAEAAGFSRKAVTIAWGHLLEGRVVVPAGDATGYFRINKQYREWAERHALSEVALAFADAGLEPALPGYIQVLPIGNTQQLSEVLPIGNTTDVAGVTDRLQEVLPIGNTFGRPPKNPPIRNEIKEDSTTSSPSVANIRGFDEVMDAARETFPEFAVGLPGLAHDIGRTLGGRYDCYAAALRAARKRVDSGRDINDLHAYCLQVARHYRTTGLPAAGPIRVAGVATPTPIDESPSRRRQRELIEGFARKAARNQEASTDGRE